MRDLHNDEGKIYKFKTLLFVTTCMAEFGNNSFGCIIDGIDYSHSILLLSQHS